METYKMTKEQIQSYAQSLRMEEHSESTVQKYANALTVFYDWLSEDKSVTKERLLLWKAEISAKNAASTVNVMISAVNRFFAFMSWDNLRVKQVKTQRRIFRDRDRELTKTEYLRLLNAAWNGNLRLYYLMQTLGSTGIRISDFPAKSPSVRFSVCSRIPPCIRERGDSGRLWWERLSAASVERPG